MIPLLFLSAAALCLSPFAEANGRADPNMIWNKKSLTVCFADTSSQITSDTAIYSPYGESRKDIMLDALPPLYRQVMTDALKASYSIAKNGVELVGFKDCWATPDYDVAIFYSQWNIWSQSASAATIGDPSKQPDTAKFHRSSVRINNSLIQSSGIPSDTIKELYSALGMDANTNYWNDFGRNFVALIIVHEFGHVLGLNHEHDRDDAYPKNKAVDFALANSNQSSADAYHQEANSSEANIPGIKNIGAMNLLSTMNYQNINISTFAYMIDLFCQSFDRLTYMPANSAINLKYIWNKLAMVYHQAPYPYVPAQLKKWMCTDQTYVELLLPSIDSKQSYLSEGDVETLRFLYLNETPQNLFLAKERKYIQYLSSWPKEVGFAWAPAHP